MSENIQNINLKTKNSQGDILILYPMTKVENVIGLIDTLDTKADKSNTYTKNEIDLMIANIAKAEENEF